MTTLPKAAMNEAVAAEIALAEPDPTRLAVMLADEILARGGWKPNTCKPLLRAYEIARAKGL